MMIANARLQQSRNMDLCMPKWCCLSFLFSLNEVHFGNESIFKRFDKSYVQNGIDIYIRGV